MAGDYVGGVRSLIIIIILLTDPAFLRNVVARVAVGAKHLVCY